MMATFLDLPCSCLFSVPWITSMTSNSKLTHVHDTQLSGAFCTTRSLAWQKQQTRLLLYTYTVLGLQQCAHEELLRTHARNCCALMQKVALQLHMWCCRMIKHHPEDALGPHIDWREHSILNNSQFPPEDIAQTAHIHICQVRKLATRMTICFSIGWVHIFPASSLRQALSKPPDKELPLW